MTEAGLTNGPVTDISILIVEDEENLAEALRYNMEREGYAVSVANDGAKAVRSVREAVPDLIVLDVMLPVLDGFEVCRILRKETAVPILMLTAKDDVIDRVLGLELGADDYLPKPFSMRELTARIRAILRRTQTAKGLAETGSQDEVHTSEDLRIDLGSHTVTLAGNNVQMRPREFDLLALLVANKGRVQTRNQILDKLWGTGYVGDTRTVDVHVRWLREKIEEDPGRPVRIVTVRGVGYRFEG